MNGLFLIRFFEDGKLTGYHTDNQKGRIVVYKELVSAERAVRQLQNKSYNKKKTIVISQIDSLTTVHRYEPQKSEPEFLIPKPADQ